MSTFSRTSKDIFVLTQVERLGWHCYYIQYAYNNNFQYRVRRRRRVNLIPVRGGVRRFREYFRFVPPELVIAGSPAGPSSNSRDS